MAAAPMTLAEELAAVSALVEDCPRKATHTLGAGAALFWFKIAERLEGGRTKELPGGAARGSGAGAAGRVEGGAHANGSDPRAGWSLHASREQREVFQGNKVRRAPSNARRLR